MRTEMDELVLRATNDRSIDDTDLGRVIVSVIEKTRRFWTADADKYLSPDAVIGVGVGYAALTRDGRAVYEENGGRYWDLMTVAQAEELARKEPTRDWRIHLVAQLKNRHYRRDGERLWVLYERGYGMS
jgi:hypothetical protein